MCSCGVGEPCNVAISHHCSTALIRITPQPLKVCVQTLKSYLATRPLKTRCKLDAQQICSVLCCKRSDDGLYHHKYDAVCMEIGERCTSFEDIGEILMKHGTFLSVVTFRHFCSIFTKFSRLVFFHPDSRNLVCARGRINVYDSKSLYESIRSTGSFGLPLTQLGASYEDAGRDINTALQDGACVVVCNRIYSTNVAQLAKPGALQEWATSHRPRKRPRRL